MRALSGARYTGVRLYTLWIKIGTNQRALGEHSHYWTRLCSLIVAVSWEISVSNYWKWIWSAHILCLKYVHTCILNTYMYLKLYNQNINLRQWNLQSHKFYCFIKDMCTLSLWSNYWTLSMLNFNMCVCVGGDYFYVVVFIAIFFEFRAKLPDKQNLEEYFHRQHFNANIFI